MKVRVCDVSVNVGNIISDIAEMMDNIVVVVVPK